MITFAIKTDLPEVAKLWVNMVDELKPKWEPDTLKWIECCERLIETGLYRIAICVKHSKIIGFLDGMVFYDPSVSKIIGFGKTFYVMPEYRNTEIAGGLYEKIIKFAKDNGADTVEIYCLQEKLKYWEDKGFVKTQLVLRREI